MFHVYCERNYIKSKSQQNIKKKFWKLIMKTVIKRKGILSHMQRHKKRRTQLIIY